MNIQSNESHLVVSPPSGEPLVVDTAAHFETALNWLSSESGPVAVDTERASGFRYRQSAYLVQLRRGDAPAVLVDPVAFDQNAFDELQSVIGSTEWILHAATQDLPSLNELGLQPERLFDTELAARLLNLPHVGLGGLLDDLLGIHLKKEHSAADWSRRPLPDDWLAYAALDVEYLDALRNRLIELLDEQRKLSFAHEEFDAELGFTPKPAPEEPWRKMHGLSSVRTPAQLKIVRELWRERDEIARSRDLSPHRLIPDRAIIAAATTKVRNSQELLALKDFNGRAASTQLRHWWAAVQRGRSTDEPISLRAPSTGIPGHRSWPSRHPEAHERLEALKSAATAVADEHDLPRENLVAPQALRDLAWQLDGPVDAQTVRSALVASGAREWQIQLFAPAAVQALESAGQEPS